MIDHFKETANTIFDIVFLNLLFIPISLLSFGLLFLPLYAVGITSIVRINYLEQGEHTVISAFRLLKNNFFELMIHNILHLALILMMLVPIVQLSSMYYTLGLVVFFTFVTFEVIFWFVLGSRKLSFFGYYKLTFILLLKYAYFILVVGATLMILFQMLYNQSYWILIFFPFGWTYIYTIFYASKIRLIEGVA